MGGTFDYGSVSLPGAEMTAGGKIAAYAPDGSKVQYFDAASSGDQPSLPAGRSVTFNGLSATITQVGTASASAPMVNSHGQVVLDALLNFSADPTSATTSPDLYPALISWNAAGDGGISVIAAADPFDAIAGTAAFNLPVDGVSRHVNNLFLNTLGSTGDVFNSAFNDNGQLAFGVSYDTTSPSDPANTVGTAVLETTIAVPEPTALSLLALAAVPALSRRRRKA